MLGQLRSLLLLLRGGFSGSTRGATSGTTGMRSRRDLNGGGVSSGDAGFFVKDSLLLVGTEEMGPTAVGGTEGVVEIVGY